MIMYSKNEEGKEMSRFEEQMQQIEHIVELLEGGSLSLEESIEQYREGARLIQECQKTLENAKYEVEEIRNTIRTVQSNE